MSSIDFRPLWAWFDEYISEIQTVPIVKFVEDIATYQNGISEQEIGLFLNAVAKNSNFVVGDNFITASSDLTVQRCVKEGLQAPRKFGNGCKPGIVHDFALHLLALGDYGKNVPLVPNSFIVGCGRGNDLTGDVEGSDIHGTHVSGYDARDFLPVRTAMHFPESITQFQFTVLKAMINRHYLINRGLVSVVMNVDAPKIEADRIDAAAVMSLLSGYNCSYHIVNVNEHSKHAVVRVSRFLVALFESARCYDALPEPAYFSIQDSSVYFDCEPAKLDKYVKLFVTKYKGKVPKFLYAPFCLKDECFANYCASTLGSCFVPCTSTSMNVLVMGDNKGVALLLAATGKNVAVLDL